MVIKNIAQIDAIYAQKIALTRFQELTYEYRSIDQALHTLSFSMRYALDIERFFFILLTPLQAKIWLLYRRSRYFCYEEHPLPENPQHCLISRSLLQESSR